MSVEEWKRLNFEDEHQFSECDVDHAYSAGVADGRGQGIRYAEDKKIVDVTTYGGKPPSFMSEIRELGFCALCASPVFGFDDTEQPLIHGACSQVREDAARECLALCQEHFSGTKFRSEYELGCVETASDIAHDISRKFGLEI